MPAVLEPEVIAEVDVRVRRASQVLEQAAELIKPFGKWAKKAPYNGEGYCVLGAIHSICGYDYTREGEMDRRRHYNEDLYDLAKARFKQFLRVTDDLSVTGWNDRFATTQEEVVTALQCAARMET